MTIFVSKRLIRNPEIRNTPVWVLPNNWKLEKVRDTKFGTNVSKKRLRKYSGTSLNTYGTDVFVRFREVSALERFELKSSQI